MGIFDINERTFNPRQPPRSIAITGTTGRLGGALLRRWSADPSLTILPLDRDRLPLDDPGAIKTTLADFEFDALIHCAAMTSVDQCEKQPELTHRVNTLAPAALARECRRRQARMIHVSTDYVFDGHRPGPRAEGDPCEPLSVYGKAKLTAEREVLDILPEALVARVSWVFGPEKPSFIESLLARASRDSQVGAIGDKWSAPSYTADLTDWFAALLIHPEARGIVHACNRGSCSWQTLGQFALETALDLGAPLKARRVDPQSLADFPDFIAPRPVHTAMATDRLAGWLGIDVPDWQDAVRRYLVDLKNRGTSFLFTRDAIG